MPTDPVEKVASSTMQENKTTTAFKDDHSIEAEIAETTNEKKDETLSNYDAMNDYEATEDSQNNCQYCFQCPCWLEQGLYEKLLELEESLRDNEIEKNCRISKFDTPYIANQPPSFTVTLARVTALSCHNVCVAISLTCVRLPMVNRPVFVMLRSKKFLNL